MSAELEHIWSRVQAELARRRRRAHLPHLARAAARRSSSPASASRRGSAARLPLDPASASGASSQASRRARARPAGDRRARRPTRARRHAAAAPAGARRRAARARDAAAAARSAPARAGPLGNPKLTFDQFVIGDCNRLAHAAALAVAEMPAQAYNPLFICGPPGVGKTHLLSSIANLLLAAQPGADASAAPPARPSPTSSSARSASGDTEGFKARFRHVDVLLVDDVQFLERKTTHRGGVLPHLQRPPRRRPPDRAHLRPPAARPAGARGPPARALRRPASSPTSSRPTSPRAWRSCASAPSTTTSSSPTSARSR